MNHCVLISDAAKEVQVESHVLRYWEEELHLPIKRNELGHRYYTKEDVERFKQIKSMKERGLQLKAIKMILKNGKLDVLGEGRNLEAGITDVICAQAADKIEKETMQRIEEETYRIKENAIQEMEENTNGIDERSCTEENMDADETPVMSINIVDKPGTLQENISKEEKSRKLQWMLQEMIKQAVRENNAELCRDLKESVIKELDYQFRMQEEREDAREKRLVERDEMYYRKMDELLRKKTRLNKFAKVGIKVE